ncbi:uncharacterized protein LOC116204348 [Punica granatum]|uniref:Uncharacterized protein n=2 Tax=Punica granatum TaxID=22663 RepID=A0A2I0JTV3_PUNGR|nr:uncharacterized protein LOC116204348 [Punica granatum]PKI58896.1 hypothetical protein CRG98_020642 [Punica granatum]
MTEFRPISCCNVVYKCITKVLSNGLKSFLPDFISPRQCAFVEGRSIADNILLAHELLKGYGRRRISFRRTVMADVMKAFDSIDWRFFMNIFQAIGMSKRLSDWVFPAFTIQDSLWFINGELHGYFEGRKNLRQSVPLSPYLLVMAIEVLSELLNSAALEGRLAYHPKCSKVQLTPLGFADDLMIFLKGDVPSIKTILSIFYAFYTMSGLKLNPRKIEIFCAGVDLGVKRQILQLSGFTEGALPVRQEVNAGKSVFYRFDNWFFTKRMWERVMNAAGQHRDVGAWRSQVEWATVKFKRKSTLAVILRIALQAYVYYIWKSKE